MLVSHQKDIHIEFLFSLFFFFRASDLGNIFTFFFFLTAQQKRRLDFFFFFFSRSSFIPYCFASRRSFSGTMDILFYTWSAMGRCTSDGNGVDMEEF